MYASSAGGGAMAVVVKKAGQAVKGPIMAQVKPGAAASGGKGKA